MVRNWPLGSREKAGESGLLWSEGGGAQSLDSGTEGGSALLGQMEETRVSWTLNLTEGG